MKMTEAMAYDDARAPAHKHRAAIEIGFASIRPTGDRLLLEYEPEPTMSGLLHLVPTDSERRAPKRATVRAVGPGRVTSRGVLVPMTVKIGDAVLVPRFEGCAYIVNGREMHLVREEVCEAVV